MAKKSAKVGVTSPAAPVRLRATSFGYNNGKFNVGKYSLRTKEIDLEAHVVQHTYGSAKLDARLVDLGAHVYQTTPLTVRLVVNSIKDLSGRIIQTGVTFAEWQVLPPFDAPVDVKQPTPVTIPVVGYVSYANLSVALTQKTPVYVKATFVGGISAAVTQSTPVKVKADFCQVIDTPFGIVQRTVFVPGVNAGWSPWYPINPDYPAPWNKPVREAA